MGRWELELALELKKPIIVVNLNKTRQMDDALCPAILRIECVIHVAYERDIMRFAMREHVLLKARARCRDLGKYMVLLALLHRA